MRNIAILVTALLSLAWVQGATAATLECNAPGVRIAGQIDMRYLRKGHSSFTGNLTMYTFENRVITGVSHFYVRSGDIQEDLSVSSNYLILRDGRMGRMDLNQGRASFVQFGEKRIEFIPQCFTQEYTPPQNPTCSSSIAAGQHCRTIEGRCVCHQHNSH